MGIFDFLKKKNEEKIETTNTKISDELESKIEKSTLQIMTHELFMHYWSDTLEHNPEDQSWKNQAIFFWKSDEPFEKKSLPPNFKELEHKFFIVNNAIPDDISLSSGKVMPWFGMPGNGDKYFFHRNKQEIPIQGLIELGILEYVEIITINEKNSNILTDRKNYCFLMNQSIIKFRDNNFFQDNKPISITKAIELGGLKIIKLNTKQKNSDLDEFTQKMKDLADECVEKFKGRYGNGLNFSEESLKLIDDILEDAGDIYPDFEESQKKRIIETIGSYVFEVARKNYGGKYFWFDQRQQPILVAGQPDFEISIVVYDKIKDRLENGKEDNIVYFFEGFSERVKNAKKGDRATIV